MILMDVMMPDMDGFETASLIKQRERSRYIPILFITAAGEDEAYRTEAYNVGAVDFLPKPFNPHVLKAKVSVFVELYHQRELIRRQAALLHEQELVAQHALQIEEMARSQRRFLREVLSSLTEGRLWLCDAPDELPTPLSLVSDAIELSPPTLRLLRRQVTAFAGKCGWAQERLEDFETAVGEAAMNAVVHGKGGEGRVHADPSTGLVQVWVKDCGKGIAEDSLHRATLEKGYTTAGTLGHGFHLMLRTADRVHLLTGAGGTSVVLEQGPMPPGPAWMQGYPA
jgi:CheY-like chemotaxis protein/anti-sigma regulatory factor (Ser/Thr protein kinase)